MNKRSGFRFDGLLLAASAALLVAVLGGCGGGLQLGIGTNSNDPPAVALVAGAASGARGSDLRLFADASDDDAVAKVSFYKLEDNGDSSLLGSDTARPYTQDLTLPSTGDARYYAQAEDSDGETTNSETLTITLSD